MVEHRDFSLGRVLATQGKALNEKQWKELSEVLNQLPGPEKDPYEWKKCWTDLKCNVRGRAAKAKTASTANKINKANADLTEIDMKVLSLIGMDACAGLQNQEYGLDNRLQDAQHDPQLLGQGTSGNGKVSSSPIESQVHLMPSEIKSSDSCSPPASPLPSNISLLHQIPIPILIASSDPLASSPPPDPLVLPNITPIQTSPTASEDKSALTALPAIPPTSAISMQSESSSQPTLKSTTKKSNSLSNSLAEATDRLQKSQERNTEGLKAIHQAINRMAAASEASNEIQLQFLTIQRNFTSMLEKAITHWINKGTQ
ncbi:uncharacterized protein [Hetaerina americana]